MSADKDFTQFTPYDIKADQEYMDDGQLSHFEAILNGWKKSLMKEVDKAVNSLKDESENYADPADRASKEEAFRLVLREKDRERKLIKKIDESLEDIKSGDYGFCTDCGIEIGIRRLEARPTATKCIDCKTISEMKEKQIYS